jgi:hypothetical protein
VRIRRKRRVATEEIQLNQLFERFGLGRVPGTVRSLIGPVALAVYCVQNLGGTGGEGTSQWVLLLAIGAGLILVFSRRLAGLQIMALEVLASSLVNDYTYSRGGGLRDFDLYLNAGAQFLAGHPVYTTHAIHYYPGPGGYLPFLYAPPTLPIFGVLSALPHTMAAGIWVAFSIAAVVWALRSFGLPWYWAILALAWSPIEQGLYTGNVVIPTLALLALAPKIGSSIGLGTMFKPQNGVIWLWLLRRREWRMFVCSILVFVAAVLITLPLTGIDLWFEWFKGLAAYQQSQGFMPGLYGVGLGRYLAMWQFAIVAVVVVLAALVPRGRKGLARLGLASVIASPSLWSHGFIWAIPEFLRLRGQWFWFVVGMCSTGAWPGPQAALGVTAAGWLVGPLVHRITDWVLPQRQNPPLTHPLGRRAAQVGRRKPEVKPPVGDSRA